MTFVQSHSETSERSKYSENAENLEQVENIEDAKYLENSSLTNTRPSDAAHMKVSVVWASREHVASVSLELPVGTRVEQALELSGLLQTYQPAGFSIFGQRCDLSRILSDGDRIELCRPLIVEPKAARRRRALHREKVRNIKKKMPIDDLTVS